MTSSAKYQQIADDLAAQIRSGALAPGAAVPSESELMGRYDVAAGTVRKAVALLRATQLIETHHGRGSFVRATWPTLRRLSGDFGDPAESVKFVGAVEAPVEVASRLSIAPLAPVLGRISHRLADDGQAVGEVSTYVLWEAAKEIPALFARSCSERQMLELLAQHGYPLAEFEEMVKVRLATKAESYSLALSPGTTVFEVTSTVTTATGITVVVSTALLVADRYELEVRGTVRTQS